METNSPNPKTTLSRPRWSQDVYIRAYRFAAEAHRWQRVPGTHLPYIMHLSFAAMEILAAAAVEDIEDVNLALQCALLHDTLEDTLVRHDRLGEEFGEAVAQGVLALTVNKRLPRREQMPECLGRIRGQRREVWMVKLADRITNLQPPPGKWDKHRIREYHQESHMIHEALQEASPFLAERMTSKLNQYAVFVV